MPVIEYVELDTAPLPLGEDTQALASSAENRQSVGRDGTPPKHAINAKATDK